jgi:general stress protein 26
MSKPTEAEARAKIWELIRDIEIALLVSHDESGRLHARPMGTLRPKDGQSAPGEIWFMTDANSPKVKEILKDSNVLLSYSEPKKQIYVSVAGKAQIVEDKAKIKELWSEPLRTWFPDGPEKSAIALIRVDAEAAEYWDSPSGVVLYAFGYFKARLTGERIEMGEHRKVAL